MVAYVGNRRIRRGSSGQPVDEALGNVKGEDCYLEGIKEYLYIICKLRKFLVPIDVEH